MKKKCFIFDLDGVIVDTAKYHFLAWKSIAKQFGIDFTIEQNEELKGVSRKNSLQKIIKWGNISLSKAEFENAMSAKNKKYLEYISKIDSSEILADVDRVLKFLIAKNQIISLGSASKNARPILKKLKLLKCFDFIVDGNDITSAKPDPEIFLKSAKLSQCDPSDCFVFEDSIAGITAANNANMTSIGMGNNNILKNATFNFENFKGISNQFLLNLIEK